MRRAVYVVYEGEWPVCVGTAAMCAKALGVKESTIMFYASPAKRRRDTREGTVMAVRAGSWEE